MRSIISVELDYAWRISTAIEKSNFKRTENFRKINVEPTRSDQVCLFSRNTRTAGNLLAMYLSPSLTTALFLRISKRETRTTKRVLRNPVIALKRRDILFPRIIAYRHHSVSCVTMLVNEWPTYRATQQTLLSSESSDHRFIVVPFQPIQSSLFFSLFFLFLFDASVNQLSRNFGAATIKRKFDSMVFTSELRAYLLLRCFFTIVIVRCFAQASKKFVSCWGA